MNVLKRLVPCFTIKDTNIKVLSDPKDFYQFLLTKSKSCTKRIIIASLYLGTGDLEESFIDNVVSSITTNKSNNDFRVHFLFDSNRGSRPTTKLGTLKSSRTMCQPILSDFQDTKVSFYHTPNLRGYLNKVLPYRVNEVIGLQHMKIYLFDDCLLMSGANLSADYFTNRQDRYIAFEDCPELCDFYEELVDIVGLMSYTMTIDNELTTPQCGCDPIEGNFNEYTRKFRNVINDFIERQVVKSKKREEITDHSLTEGLTQVYPLIQMGLYQVQQDETFLKKLFAHVSSSKTPQYSVALASGYLNLDDDNESLILNMARSNVFVEVLTAHPEANGFFNAKGMSGYIPDLYSYILKQFLYKSSGLTLKVYEWIKKDWTFHAKGFWISEIKDGRPITTMSLVGSTNYGFRSRYRDLETEVLIHTQSLKLQEQLEMEKKRLYHNGECAEKYIVHRAIPYWIYWLGPFIKYIL